MEFPFVVVCPGWPVVLWLKSILSKISKGVVIEHVEVVDPYAGAVTVVFYCAPMSRSDAILAYCRGEIRTEIDMCPRKRTQNDCQNQGNSDC
jgi:hypothetical protein